MDHKKLATAAAPKAMGAYLKKKVPDAKHGHAMHHSSTRTTEYNGHQIAVETSYRVEVDGKTVKLPLMVNDSGTVHCHSLPNYQFQSALELVKTMVDLFPDDFPPLKKKAGQKKPGQSHMHATMRARSAPKKSGTRRKRK